MAERRAFVCLHKSHEVPLRVFQHPGEVDPTCPEGHGKMQRQGNVPYTKPVPGTPATPKVVKAKARG